MSEAIQDMVSESEARSLKRIEIESLLRSSRDAVYTRSDGSPRKKKGNFAKTSLIDLARAAQERGAANVAATADAAAQAAPGEETQDAPQENILDPENSVEDTSVSTSDTNAEVDVEADVAAAVAALEEDTIPTQVEAGGEAEQIAGQTDEHAQDNVQNEGEAENSSIADGLSALVEAAGSGSQTDGGQDIDEAYRRGYEEGLAAGKNEIQEAMTSLTGLIDQMAAEQPIARLALEEELRQAVLHLASARAGQEIDSLPDVFVARIHQLMQMVDQAGKSLVIRINTQDLAAIKPYFDVEHPLFAGQLVGDNQLLRGDVEIRAGAISVRDLLADRAGVEDEQKFAEIGKVMRALMETPQDSNMKDDGQQTAQTSSSNEEAATDIPSEGHSVDTNNIDPEDEG